MTALVKAIVLAYLVVTGLAALVAFPLLVVPMAFRARPVEVVVAGAWTVLLLVPMGLVALAIRLESPGGAIFRQRRVGRNGKPFAMLKFRTMLAEVDPYGSSPRCSDDPRLTRMGRFLRETSLDELPQLFNVLAGTMSLVGPRPLYERQAALWTPRQRRRLEVRPGITGYAQAFGRGQNTLEEKLEMDAYYVENRSSLLDLRVVLHTIKDIVARRGDIYEQRYSREQLIEGGGKPPREEPADGAGKGRA
jgi:lipopolysaccharide/colanic/teichoic acid biosynthesis glycosyltransferase